MKFMNFFGLNFVMNLEACKDLNETKNLLPIYKEILVFIHPFAPFITEELHTIFFNAPIIER